ncbi:hypothetical protein CDAR_69921 [Caerostris darwini]|uniref:Uncharacterized protein n=1 Tax=Caerostris darwini TaxID=1538125 RepID=A0AAV4T4G5_9ARAC|nr:hypothetical protein CDAR_69921 [Caerostris darwini]
MERQGIKEDHRLFCERRQICELCKPDLSRYWIGLGANLTDRSRKRRERNMPIADQHCKSINPGDRVNVTLHPISSASRIRPFRKCYRTHTKTGQSMPPTIFVGSAPRHSRRN